MPDETTKLKLENRKLRRAMDARAEELQRFRGEREQRRAAVETRLATVTREYELRQQIADMERECQRLDAELAARAMARAAEDTGRRLGIAPTAHVDYLRRVMAAGFTARDDVPIPPAGVESLAAWTWQLRETDPHLFSPSRGCAPINGHSQPTPRWISGADPEEFGSYASAIAKGQIKVAT